MNSRLTLILVALVLALLVGGCSDQRYGSLYCPPGPRDTLVVFAEPEFQQITVISDTSRYDHEESGMSAMESLYLGSDGDTRSSILVNFDFSFNDGSRDMVNFPDSFFTLDNIRSVKLSLTKYQSYHSTFYSSSDSTIETSTPRDVFYLVRELEEPFTPGDYKHWPGPAPVTKPYDLNSDWRSNSSDEPYLNLYPEDFLAWFQSGESVGISISADPRSDEGMIGFASRESNRFQEFGALQAGTVLAPNLVVEFNDYVGDKNIFLMPPVQDTSTFESIQALPTELIHLQTGLRSYPLLTFIIPDLPDGTCLEQVWIRLNAVVVDSLWAERRECLMVSKVVFSGSPPTEGTITDRDLARAYGYPETACPDYSRMTKDLGLPLGKGKISAKNLPETLPLMFNFPDPTISYRQGGVGDLFFTQNLFHGPTAPEDLRPRLLLIYGKNGE